MRTLINHHQAESKIPVLATRMCKRRMRNYKLIPILSVSFYLSFFFSVSVFSSSTVSRDYRIYRYPATQPSHPHPHHIYCGKFLIKSRTEHEIVMFIYSLRWHHYLYSYAYRSFLCYVCF